MGQHLYEKCFNLCRAGIDLRMGSLEVSSLERSAFLGALNQVSWKEKERITEIIEDAETSVQNPGHRPIRGLGSAGSLELVAKLGMFLTTLPLDDSFFRNKG